MKNTQISLLLLTVAGIALAGGRAQAQGCVAAHTNQRVLDELVATDPVMPAGGSRIHNLTVDIGYRVFNSNKYFQGSKEIARATAVRNHQNIFDIGASCKIPAASLFMSGDFEH
jgi:hypothetical protein